MKIKYQYKTVTETVEIEIPEEWASILVELDREEANSERRETRRHCSYEAYNSFGNHISDSTDLERDAEARDRDERVREAVSELPSPQEEVIRRFYFGGETISAIADSLGVNQSAISHRHGHAKKNLKKIIDPTLID